MLNCNSMVYLCGSKISTMENKAEDTLRGLAAKADTTLKNLYALTVQAFANEQRIQDDFNKLRQTELVHAQIDLMRLQIANETIQNRLLSFTYKRKLKILTFLGLIKTINK